MMTVARSIFTIIWRVMWNVVNLIILTDWSYYQWSHFLASTVGGTLIIVPSYSRSNLSIAYCMNFLLLLTKYSKLLSWLILDSSTINFGIYFRSLGSDFVTSSRRKEVGFGPRRKVGRWPTPDGKAESFSQYSGDLFNQSTFVKKTREVRTAIDTKTVLVITNPNQSN